MRIWGPLSSRCFLLAVKISVKLALQLLGAQREGEDDRGWESAASGLPRSIPQRAAPLGRALLISTVFTGLSFSALRTTLPKLLLKQRPTAPQSWLPPLDPLLGRASWVPGTMGRGARARAWRIRRICTVASGPEPRSGSGEGHWTGPALGLAQSLPCREACVKLWPRGWHEPWPASHPCFRRSGLQCSSGSRRQLQGGKGFVGWPSAPLAEQLHGCCSSSADASRRDPSFV